MYAARDRIGGEMRASFVDDIVAGVNQSRMLVLVMARRRAARRGPARTHAPAASAPQLRTQMQGKACQ